MRRHQVLAIAGDIRERLPAQQVVAAAKERFGCIDTQVNNAGVFIAKPFDERAHRGGRSKGLGSADDPGRHREKSAQYRAERRGVRDAEG